jgi:hypothetical protein
MSEYAEKIVWESRPRSEPSKLVKLTPPRGMNLADLGIELNWKKLSGRQARTRRMAEIIKTCYPHSEEVGNNSQPDSVIKGVAQVAVDACWQGNSKHLDKIATLRLETDEDLTVACLVLDQLATNGVKNHGIDSQSLPNLRIATVAGLRPRAFLGVLPSDTIRSIEESWQRQSASNVELTITDPEGYRGYDKPEDYGWLIDATQEN